MERNIYKIGKELFITSDEEIKEGHYYYNERLNKVFQAIIKSGYNTVDKEFKIILTTDQDLIKDGVQAIDDEFLEWFVKNPSCEKVGVINTFDYNKKHFVEHSGYKIIIPKEETKTGSITECIKMIIDNQLNELEEPKQETLEEVKPMRELVVFLDRIKKNLTNKNEVKTIQIIIDTIKNEFFEKVSKWQQEQDKNMYSEEEVEHLIHLAVFQSHCGVKDRVKIPNSNECAGFVNKWFEQNKKK